MTFPHFTPGRAGRLLRIMSLSVALLSAAAAHAKETVTIGIGTQDTTTNTVTGGIVIKELGLLQKYLPKTGKYADIDFKINWQNFTSGPPVTNGMLADKIQIGMMGDYPLLINGANGQQSPGNETELVAVIAYNQYGAGNGVVVNKDSPYYQLSDLKGKTVSVPFGSAAHGMLLQAMQARGWPDDYWNLVSQTPEIGSTNLAQKKIDAHADFVPFAELLPFRGFARKIFDGAETRVPTFHGVVVRKDFAEKYPEVVVAYIKAMMAANDWVRKNPELASEKIAQWTGTDKEVVYIFLGPDGIHTLDPTIKPILVNAIKTDFGVLHKLGRIQKFDVNAWVNETYVREAFKERGRDYDAQKKSLANYDIHGTDPVCHKDITDPKNAGEVWIEGGDIVPFSSPVCTFMGIRQYQQAGKKIAVAYVFDRTLGIKVFADKAFYSVSGAGSKLDVVPFLLKKDAQAWATKNGGTFATYDQVLAKMEK